MTDPRIHLARARVTALDEQLRDADVRAASLIAERELLLRTGATSAVGPVEATLAGVEAARMDLRNERRAQAELIAQLALLDRRSPEESVAFLDGQVPVALLPVRIETRFKHGGDELDVRIFPDPIHIDAHDPALTPDEVGAARWYWETRWAAPTDEAEAARAWEALVSRFRPGRARYIVDRMRPLDPLGHGDLRLPDVPTRPAGPGRRAEASALPHRWAAIGYQEGPDGLFEVFRVWSGPVPERLAVVPSLDPEQPTEGGGLPVDPALEWLHEPDAARRAGMMLTVRQADLRSGRLRNGLARLVVVGVGWTRSASPGTGALEDLLTAHVATGKLAFVVQGTPTNNTGERRSGFDSSRQSEAMDWAPHKTTEVTDGAAAQRLSMALGLPEAPLLAAPGASRREHLWSSALVDALWEATGGYFLNELLDPEVATVDADALRDHAAAFLFAGGPLPTIRVGAQPYGVLPVVAPASLELPRDARAETLIARVGGRMRAVWRAQASKVPHLGRAADRGALDDALVALLQRTPVPWTLRFRHLVGSTQRKALHEHWEVLARYQHAWSVILFPFLGIAGLPRLGELTHDGETHRLDVPLVKKGDGGTSWLGEIAALLARPDARTLLDLRQDSATLLEALVAFAAVREMDRAAGELVVRRLPANPDLAAIAHASGLVERPYIRAPDTMRVEPPTPPSAAPAARSFKTPHELASARIPGLSDKLTVAEEVVRELAAARAAGFDSILHAPAPLHRLARFERALGALAQAPTDELEWAFRGYLDLHAARLDAWITSLATARLDLHRRSTRAGTHVGCFGWVEDLRPDTGPGAESEGYVLAPSLAHASAAAVLRAGRRSHRGASGDIFDIEISSERTREALWLLDGAAQGQSVAALLGYRIERRLRESLTLARYILPLRRQQPVRHLDPEGDAPLEAVAARDVVDGLTILRRWRDEGGALLTRVGVEDAAHREGVGRILDEVAGLYDAVSDVHTAESVYQVALGNLDRAGAALAAHDRQERPLEPEFVRTPRSGHTCNHRVVAAMQEQGPAPGWPSTDPRRRAEPRLDCWLGRVFGPPETFVISARRVRANGVVESLRPVPLSDLGLGPISVVLAAQRPGREQPSELEVRLALRFAAQVDLAEEGDRVELLTDGVPEHPGGLGLLLTLATRAAALIGAPTLTAAEFGSPDEPEASTADVAELDDRVRAVVDALAAARAAVDGAGPTGAERFAALEAAVPFAPLDALPRVPANHPDAAAVLGEQLAAVGARLAAVARTVDERRGAPGVDVIAHRRSIIQAALGPGQPVLPTFRLDAPAEVAASLADRAALLGGDPLAPVAWLHQRALVRSPLDPLAALLTHAEADGADVHAQLQVINRPHRPGFRWCGLALGKEGPPPAGTVGVLVHAWGPLWPDRPVAGLVVDGWSETIPAAAETAAVSFHYDAPGARAPQAVLLAVHPALRPGKWDFDTLLATVREAVELTHLRPVSAAELGALSTLLPALYLPDNYTHDVPALSLKDLILTAKRLGLHTETVRTVLGKD